MPPFDARDPALHDAAFHDAVPFDVRDPAFHDAVPEGARLEPVSTGHTFTEGPIWHPDGWLVFSDIAASRQWRWRPSSNGGETTLFRAPSNQANGNAFDPQGRIVSCEHATSQVVRHEHDGKLVRPIATHYPAGEGGRELNSPNDLVVDAKGRVFFTDPLYGRTRADLGLPREPELDFQGVYRLDPDGTLTLLADDFENPNGLCFSVDGTRLFVNDSPRGHIRVFDLRDGAVSGGAVWADVTGEGSDVSGSEAWVPDGMKTDTAGRIWCNGPGGVHLFSSDARSLGVVFLPEKSTNFCFGGEGLRDLFITASTGVYRLRTAATGLSMIPA